MQVAARTTQCLKLVYIYAPVLDFFISFAMAGELSWRLHKLKERQDRMRKQKSSGSNAENRKSDSDISYYQQKEPMPEEMVVETYTNPNPVCRYSPLYQSQDQNSPSFARRHSDFSTALSRDSSSRNSVYLNGSTGSVSAYSSLGNVQGLINAIPYKRSSQLNPAIRRGEDAVGV